MRWRHGDSLSFGFVPRWKMLLVIAAVMFGLPMIVSRTPLPSNPFTAQHLSGTLQAWDSTQQAGWLSDHDKFIHVQLPKDHPGQVIAVGCTLTIQGSYKHHHPLGGTVFVAEMVIVNHCP